MNTEDIDLTALHVGFAFPEQHIQLDRATVEAYLVAVGDQNPIYSGPGGVVPPTAIMALAMRGLAGLLAAHPGTLHMSQRIAAHEVIEAGAQVTAQLTVKSRSERRGFAAISLAVNIICEERRVQDGTILLMVPLASKGA